MLGSFFRLFGEIKTSHKYAEFLFQWYLLTTTFNGTFLLAVQVSQTFQPHCDDIFNLSFPQREKYLPRGFLIELTLITDHVRERGWDCYDMLTI